MQINLSLDLPSFLTYGGFSRDGRLNRGLYNLTGRDLTLSRTITPVQMDSGTFTLTGNTLSTGAIVGLDTGSFSITGNDYRVDYGLSLDSGSFVLTGNTLATGLVVGLDTGSFSLTGNNFSSVYEINLDPNSFSLTGNNLTESVVRASVDFDTGSFSLTGNDLMVTLVALTVDMDAGSFSLTGNDLTTGGGAATTSIIGVQDSKSFPSLNATSMSASCTLGTTSRSEIWVGVYTFDLSGDGTPTATVGGNAMTETLAMTHPAGIGMSIRYFKYQDDGALGTSATVAVSYGAGTPFHAGFVVFTVDGATAVLDTYAATGSPPATGTITTDADGWAIYGSIYTNVAAGTSPAGFGNDEIWDVGTSEWAILGYASPASGSSTSITNSASANGALAGLSVSPA